MVICKSAKRVNISSL